MKTIFVTILCITLAVVQSIGQTTMIDIFTKLITAKGDSVIVDYNEEIRKGNISPLCDIGVDVYLRKRFKNLELKDNRIVIRKTLVIKGIPKEECLYWLNDFHFTKPVFISIQDEEYQGQLDIRNCIFEKGFLFNGNLKNGVIVNSSIHNYFNWLSSTVDYLLIDNSSFKFDAKSENYRLVSFDGKPFEPMKVKADTLSRYRHQVIREDFFLYINHINNLTIKNNSFNADGLTSIASIMSAACKNFFFVGNLTNQLVDLNGLVVNNSLTFTDNKLLSYISLSSIEFPPFINKVKILWDQFLGNKIVITEHDRGFGSEINAIYTAKTQQELSNTNSFTELTGSYQSLLNIYKLNGDLASTNGCFSELKDIQGSRLKNEYEIHGGFNNYFSWKINRLLKVYTNHGTEPALAVAISLYVILFFGIIFYFFPSDWDVTSKSRLIQNFKDFIQKNEKGYVIPFFVLIGGFVISLINAITLSINAFTTLGFGNIPTHGLARYLCIIEGFIGWFLLSIFTVALINQVSI